VISNFLFHLLYFLKSGGKWELASERFIQQQIAKGRCKNEEDFKNNFKFREYYSERIFSYFGEGVTFSFNFFLFFLLSSGC
jgi:hypothetical protein